ncbi:MAG: DUF983 domain-containing protein [Acetobacteraceae bacterium]|nr:DUF983 domain-containing protein [Acetobacteraceae bacterium]
MWTGLRRGLAIRCPVCGQGRVLYNFLQVRTPCEVCGADNSVYPSDDFPPYLTIFAVGHIIIPLFLLVDRAYAPPIWVGCAIWLPLTLILCLLLLPRMKGATIGFCWAAGIERQAPVSY